MRIFPLSRSADIPFGLPSLQHVQIAGVVCLTEISGTGTSILHSITQSNATTKSRDWISLLLKELLGSFRVGELPSDFFLKSCNPSS